MSRNEKLIKRLLSVPNDFTWEELIRVVRYFGYEEFNGGRTGGSRRKFIDAGRRVISLHKPHPSSIVKNYAIIQVIEHLKAKGHIADE